MFGKHGRGGGAGRGSGKRPLPVPVQLHRPAAVGGTRPPISVSSVARVRNGAPGASGAAAAAAAASAPGWDETFSLEPGELDFGAIIRLTPDLVDEIRRLEAQGGATRIKFDSNANNSAGNVIDVGGKEFRFTWSREPTDLCDIYEERQNGEDGDGLLAECGSAWRKLNVQRILDESTKNHVKMRSEEAERMLKSRKAIVLDPTNPSVKNQAKSMAAAAVEGNMRRMSWKHKEMFFKKRKVEPNQGAVTVAKPKSIFKSSTASNGNFKGIPSSPVPSPLQQPVPRASLSPAGPGNTLRGDANPGEITPPLNINKEEIEIFEKGMPTGVARGSMQEINGYKGGTTDPPIDLQSMLRTLLSQNPKGMSLKVLEKAVGERIPNSVKKVENVLKNIATFQAPGRYFLKQGGQVESSKRSESGSSPECSNKHTSKAASVLSVKASDARLNQETELRSKHEEESDLFERIDIVQDIEDPLSGDGKAKDDRKLREGSSSESGSDSDSESDSSDSGSDSGSQSRSRSKSKSPAGSGSSSSDSESDGSSSSKEPSDVDVDIMTSDGEKGVAVQKIEATEPRLSSLPMAWRFDGEHDIIDTNERDEKESAVSPALDLTDFESTYERANSDADTKNLLIDRSAKSFENLEARTVENIDSYLQKSKSRSSADGIDLSPNHNKVMENQHAPHFGYSDNDKDKIFERKALNKEKNMKDRTGYAQLNNHERVPKTNTKRSYNSEYIQEKLENAKRTKASSSAEAYFGKVKRASSSENSYYISPERSRHMDQTMKMNNNLQWDEKRQIDLSEERLNEQATEPSSHNVADSIVRKKAFDMEKPNKYVEILGRTNKHPETVCGSPESDAFAVKNKLVQDKVPALKEKPDENGCTPAEYLTKNVKDSILGEKTSSAPEQVNRKSNEGYPSQFSNPDVYGKGNVLRRELSDLELGELREPPGDEMVADKGQFERKSSFKKMENKVTVSDLNADLNLGKCNENAVSESKKQSSPSSRGGMNEKVLADDSLDLARSQSRLVQPQSRQSARVDFAGSATMAHLDKCAELGGKNETRMDQLVGAENQASGLKKSAANTLAKDDYRHQGFVGCKNVKDSKSSKSNGLKGSADRGTDGFLIDNGIDSRKSVEFSFDEENALYMKYEKDELDLRGPIKDREKYNEYVQEYQEKYTHYCSLYKKLEKTRIDFLKVGDDLQLASGRDMRECSSLVEKLRRMYHQCGDRHKRMKKIFILLHEELKTLKQRIMDFADLHFRE